MKFFLSILIVFVSRALVAQPYIDIAKFHYRYSPAAGIGEKRDSLESHFFSFNLMLPIELKKGGDAIILNPFFDHNQGRIASNSFHVASIGVMAGFFKKDIFRKWDILSGVIVRRNKQAEKKTENSWQWGGILLSTWKKNQYASLKFGLYYNKEFFGDYFMPLFGIDWKINRANNLFGVLPGNLTFEHKASRSLYYGINFRALTNSYRLPGPNPCAGRCPVNYLRVDDNQLGLFGDLYIAKNLALSPELGYTVLRRYRFGRKSGSSHTYNDFNNDNFYFRIQLAYRIHRPGK